MRVGDFSPVFGKNIRYLRKQCGLSQKSPGRLVGIPGAEIKKAEWAVGVVHLDFQVFERLGQVFGVEIFELVEKDLEETEYQMPQYADAYYPAVYEERQNRI